MALDYSKLGLKCGIEIHQQLDTRKLFCSCPSVIRDDSPDVIVHRRMRAVAGEMGDVDPAALHEFLKNREITYEAYSDTNCLVELDEEPPHPINQEALSTVVTVALLLNAKPVPELQVMRKTVIDGSNTSGFQRTVLVAMDGFLDTPEGRVGVPTICLEEDAARIIEDAGGKVTYRLDRLGIPLVEITTDPDIKSPEHARQVAEKIGLILRATGKVKRGLGTIRQDLNVSIKGGERIEVKGVQELRAIPVIVENEVKRQLALIEIKKELSGRKVKPDDFEVKPGKFTVNFQEVTDCFSDDDRTLIRKSIEVKRKFLGMRLPGFAGLLGRELMPDHRFGTELSHVVKATTGLGGILHSDETANDHVSKKLGCGSEDAWVVVIVEASVDASHAFSKIRERCRQAFFGVPKETRRPDGEKTGYMRPLPGSDRMYPETDEPPINIRRLAQESSKNLPKLPDEKRKDYAALGLSEELANQLVHSRMQDYFARFAVKYGNVKPTLIAQTLLSTPKEVKKRYGSPVEALTREHFDAVFSAVGDGVLTGDAIVEVIRFLAESPQKSVSEIISEKGLGLVSGKGLAQVIDEILSETGEFKSQKHALGLVMARVSGRARPEEIMGILAEKGVK
ncbi:MAG: Glu-tRNA(Gln) amidotransferase subunit GatE [Candidatus Altiarchaeota archaeon]